MKKIKLYLKDVWERGLTDDCTYVEAIVCIFIGFALFIGIVIVMVTFPIWVLPYVIVKSRKF